ncbi:NrfD/PsrC family molybdoenzyme membrane anchor subunit [Streptomyces sp. PTD9-10]|uniref:NrfD/PsrC family molybdoenzyme membrane anchor subunit n=1 Tax=unclassified Streptomyces TaxID=2593676 RepID=UPI003008E5E0
MGEDEAVTGRGARERPMVPRAQFRSYYGRPILKRPTWKVPDVPGYLFLGGTAGASATMAAVAELTGRRDLAGAGRQVAAAASVASVAALVHDLGRPERFTHMLRVFKPTSPLSVGSWILAPFSTLATAAAASQVTGRLPGPGRVAGIGSAVLGPAMCTYTAVLLSDTAVPAWHEAYPELPYVFAGSALTSAAGAALLCAPRADHGPPIRMGLLGACMELAAVRRIERRLGLVGEPYVTGRPGRLLTLSKALVVAGAGLSLLPGRRAAPLLAGGAYLAAGLCTRFGVFAAGIASAQDPVYVVTPQRQRLGTGGSDGT